MKTLIRIITGIACIMLLFLGATLEATAPVIVTAVICIAWLALVAFATLRKEKRHE